MTRETPTVDLRIDARWIIPVEPANTVLEHHSLVVDEGRIAALLPTAVAADRYVARTIKALEQHVLIPGLVNLHTHAAMTLMRGLGDDANLTEWLEQHIWPTEMRFVSPDMVRDGTLLACAEMLRGGVTCFNDMYFFPEAAAEAALNAGMRAALGIIVVDFPSPYASDAEDYIAKGLATRDVLRDEPLLSFCVAPHAPYSVSDSAFERVATYAAELDLPIHIHLHESADEIREGLKRHGVRPMERLRRLGLLGPNLIGVHAVHLEAHEIDTLAAEGCHVAHCPASNLKLGSGIPPVTALRRAGVNVGLGTDGAASNNRLDLLGEMRLAALLARGSAHDATALPAAAALEMATINPARALGLDHAIGSLLPGKAADLVAIDLSSLELAPCYDPMSHLVYAAGREAVSHVWIRGEPKVEGGVLTALEVEPLKAKAVHWRDRIRG